MSLYQNSLSEYDPTEYDYQNDRRAPRHNNNVNYSDDVEKIEIDGLDGTLRDQASNVDQDFNSNDQSYQQSHNNPTFNRFLPIQNNNRLDDAYVPANNNDGLDCVGNECINTIPILTNYMIRMAEDLAIDNRLNDIPDVSVPPSNRGRSPLVRRERASPNRKRIPKRNSSTPINFNEDKRESRNAAQRSINDTGQSSLDYNDDASNDASDDASVVPPQTLNSYLFQEVKGCLTAARMYNILLPMIKANSPMYYADLISVAEFRLLLILENKVQICLSPECIFNFDFFNFWLKVSTNQENGYAYYSNFKKLKTVVLRKIHNCIKNISNQTYFQDYIFTILVKTVEEPRTKSKAIKCITNFLYDKIKFGTQLDNEVLDTDEDVILDACTDLASFSVESIINFFNINGPANFKYFTGSDIEMFVPIVYMTMSQVLNDLESKFEIIMGTTEGEALNLNLNDIRIFKDSRLNYIYFYVICATYHAFSKCQPPNEWIIQFAQNFEAYLKEVCKGDITAYEVIYSEMGNIALRFFSSVKGNTDADRFKRLKKNKQLAYKLMFMSPNEVDITQKVVIQ